MQLREKWIVFVISAMTVVNYKMRKITMGSQEKHNNIVECSWADFGCREFRGHMINYEWGER